MPTLTERTWREIVDDARRRNVVDLTREARQRLARIYVDEIDRVYSRLGRGEITAEAAKSFLADLRRGIVRAQIIEETEVKRIMLTAAERARDTYQAAAQEIARIAGVEPSSFAGVPVEAVERVFIKREMGLIRSFKSLRAYSSNLLANEVDAVFESATAQGIPNREFASRLAQAIINQDEHAKAAVELFGHGPQLARWARQAKDSPLRDQVKVAAKVGYNARRIARSEPAQAYHEAAILSARRSRVVKGQKWNLSGRHPEPDICDLLARIDLYGLGPGVYPVGYAPQLPHPYCLCFLTDVLRERSEWGKPLPTPGPPRTVTAAEAAVHMPGATANAMGRAIEELNEINQRIFEMEQEARRAA